MFAELLYTAKDKKYSYSLNVEIKRNNIFYIIKHIQIFIQIINIHYNCMLLQTFI